MSDNLAPFTREGLDEIAAILATMPKRMVVCAKCGAVLPYEETREHTRTHK